jgi:6-phosphogluconolactonase
MKRRHLLSLPAAALMPATAATPSPRFLHVGTYAPLGQGLYSFAICSVSPAAAAVRRICP